LGPHAKVIFVFVGRPLTCYTGSLLAEIDNDLELDETAVQEGSSASHLNISP
jgi:hypothetical protein